MNDLQAVLTNYAQRLARNLASAELRMELGQTYIEETMALEATLELLGVPETTRH